ncbi:MAG: MarR family transcriptional regulator [Pseudomonadota bacterium]
MSNRALAVETEPLSKDRLRLWLSLLKATRTVESELRERFRLDYGSTLPRFDVMSALSRFPDGLKMSELSGVLKVSNGNVTGIVDRLVAEGLVLRKPVPGDRRAARVLLTQAGVSEFDRQARAHENWIDELLGSVNPADTQSLAEVLRSISNDKEEGSR